VLAVVAVVLGLVLIFARRASAAKYKTLYTFKGGKDGSALGANLSFDKAGNLYSTTELGGNYGCGTVFQLTPNGDGSWTRSILHSFNGVDGNMPVSGSVIFDANGEFRELMLLGSLLYNPHSGLVEVLAWFFPGILGWTVG